VLELEVAEGSQATVGTLAEIGLPERCLVAALIKQEIVHVPGAGDTIVAGDIAVLLVEEDVIDNAISFFSS
jgi:trk system potassium uptake protein TrkA